MYSQFNKSKRRRLDRSNAKTNIYLCLCINLQLQWPLRNMLCQFHMNNNVSKTVTTFFNSKRSLSNGFKIRRLTQHLIHSFSCALTIITDNFLQLWSFSTFFYLALRLGLAFYKRSKLSLHTHTLSTSFSFLPHSHSPVSNNVNEKIFWWLNGPQISNITNFRCVDAVCMCQCQSQSSSSTALKPYTAI